MIETILPGATLGVLGGGQLGRMFVHAAQRMGYYTAVLDPDPASPAGLIAHHHVQASYEDEQALVQLAQRSAAITTEFENVPAAALRSIGAQRPVAPGADAVSTCQHRAAEKVQFVRCGVACAPHAVIETREQLASVIDAQFLPGLLKTSRLGYDGKGQQRVATRDELEAAWDALERAPCVLERLLPLKCELSVIVARNAAGECVHFPVQRNLHRAGILAVTEVPARGVGDKLQQQAIAAAEHIAQDMRYAGVMCVEFFVLEDGSLVANEIAPRPHNSGHYTLDACDVSQFELQVRTLAGLPLAAPRLHSPAVMLNLLGELWLREGALENAPAWRDVLALPGTHLHLYGKPSVRRGRKMGHLTITAATAERARATALEAAALLGIDAF
jgi:5-(carboxyamino)imidazole ribonucleotide synthase